MSRRGRFGIPDKLTPEKDQDEYPPTKVFNDYLEEKKRKAQDQPFRSKNTTTSTPTKTLDGIKPWSPSKSNFRRSRRSLKGSLADEAAKESNGSKKRKAYQGKEVPKIKAKKKDPPAKKPAKTGTRKNQTAAKARLAEEQKSNIERKKLERETNLQMKITEMTDSQRQDLLIKLGKRYPVLLFSLLEQPAGGGGQGYHPPASSNTPQWCICTRCREMPKAEERKCCRQRPEDCISQQPEMDILILEPLVLRLQRNYRDDIFALGEPDDENKANRHAAYRQFVLWQHGYLGLGNRRIIYSCCIWRIRDRYPDPFGQYTGFKVGSLG